MQKPKSTVLLGVRQSWHQERRVLPKATIDTGVTSSFINEELADRLADKGRITRTRRQVRLADGRCSRISSQLEITVKFGNKQLEMNLLILPGVVDELVLGWNFLTGVGAEIKCAGHELRIPARKRHNGCLEERLSVAVDSHVSDEEDIEKFLDEQLAKFSTMS
ncbi:uncharacterized protein LOC123037624 [Drosophila rhopaloa]|uniref:Uncharacterized protein n=1 Tax=Drosophila rhopaloa TaxID=1041015 RepID=A0ABM5J8R3_DRORH|nr:uncharacterized protein LOC123037624 [Drosophila rhopaloa]